MKLPCLLLAAGESKRMGRPKQLLPYRGKPLVRHMYDTARSVCSEVWVVQGAVDLTETLDDDGSRQIIHNEHYRQGQITSLRAGLTFLKEGKGYRGALFVLLGDLPLLQSATFTRLSACYARADSPPDVLYPRWQGRRGHPVLLGPAASELILEDDSFRKAREILSTLNTDFLDVDDPGICQDLDRREDYDKLITK